MKKTSLHRAAAGFTLVEALVALVVLSIGMLGIAALYVESLRAGRTALTRTQAIALAGDMADRIRANRAGGTAYAKVATDAGALSVNCQQGGTAASCNSAVMADHDKAVWNAEVARALPGGTAEVFIDSVTTPITYTIRVSWVETGQDGVVTYQLSIQA